MKGSEVYFENQLRDLFDKQSVLQRKMKNFPLKGNKQKQEFININVLACLDELSEILRETAWKNPKYIKYGWKKTQKLNPELFKEEIIDLWHFIINLSLVSGMDSDELYRRFINKNKTNHKRQKDGY